MRDVDTHVFPLDILIPKGTDLTDTQAGRIHEGDHSLLLQVGDRGNKQPGFLLGGDKGKKFVKSAHGEVGGIPWLM